MSDSTGKCAEAEAELAAPVIEPAFSDFTSERGPVAKEKRAEWEGRLRESILRRLAILERIGKDPKRQAVALAMCAADPVRWIEDFVWTFDPREKPASLPFDLFPRQAEFIQWLLEREEREEDGVAEKCRDVGFTWLCAAYAVHRWLFRDGFTGGFGSRKLELVDKIGDPSSIFEKLRHILRNLPEWMAPPGFKWSDHDNFAKLINPANGSTITGEGGDNIGRGGRCSVYFLDEFAFVPHADAVDAAVSQTSRVKLFVSTPNGQGNAFYRKRFSGEYPVFTFRWRDDPRKDDLWYAEQCRKHDSVVVAQEIDINYAASQTGITIPADWVQAAVELELPASGPVKAGYDVAGPDGKDRNVLIGRRGPVVIGVASWNGLNTTQSAHRAADEAEEMGAETLYYDAVGVGQGIRGALESTERKLKFAPKAIIGGATPTEVMWPDGRSSKERFFNYRAELWWLLRCRFERAFEYVTQGIAHAPEEMISIPRHEGLIGDLSLLLHDTTERGKIQLESKRQMRQRGVKSPDFGDALAYSFAPEVEAVSETPAYAGIPEGALQQNRTLPTPQLGLPSGAGFDEEGLFVPPPGR